MKKFLLLAIICATALASYAGDLKTKYRTALVLAYSPANNFFEDDNVRLEIYNDQLWVINKTQKTIFIDLSQSFFVHNGYSYPMYDSSKQDQKPASKKNASTDIEEFKPIAPSPKGTPVCYLATGIYGTFSTTESPSGNFSEYEERFLSLVNEMLNESLEADSKGKQYLGTAQRHLTEDESVNNIGASIAYAFNKRSEEWTSVAVSTWVSDIYLTPYYVEMPKEISKKEQRGFGLKKTEAAKIRLKADSPFEFDQERAPMIVTDWTGDFKKGTFELGKTWIYKTKKMGFGKILGATLATIATGGMGAVLFANYDEIYYKREVIFEGKDTNWGKLEYMDNKDLTQFNNKR